MLNIAKLSLDRQVNYTSIIAGRSIALVSFYRRIARFAQLNIAKVHKN